MRMNVFFIEDYLYSRQQRVKSSHVVIVLWTEGAELTCGNVYAGLTLHDGCQGASG